MDVVLTTVSGVYCGACLVAVSVVTLGVLCTRQCRCCRSDAGFRRSDEDDHGVEMVDLLEAEGEGQRPGRRAGLSIAFKLCGSCVHEGPFRDFLARAALPPEQRPLCSHTVSKVLMLRLLGFVYAFAFLCIAFQARTLIGTGGLTPTSCGAVHAVPGSPRRHDCWFAEVVGLDRSLECIGWAGAILGALQFAGVDSAGVSLALYALYLTFYRMARHAGGFFHYGWDFQILETGFLATFVTRPFCDASGAPLALVVWLFRLQSFRLMLGAGRSKLMAREPCWQWDRLDCMAFHYETTGPLFPPPSPPPPFLSLCLPPPFQQYVLGEGRWRERNGSKHTQDIYVTGTGDK